MLDSAARAGVIDPPNQDDSSERNEQEIEVDDKLPALIQVGEENVDDECVIFDHHSLQEKLSKCEFSVLLCWFMASRIRNGTSSRAGHHGHLGLTRWPTQASMDSNATNMILKTITHLYLDQTELKTKLCSY